MVEICRLCATVRKSDLFVVLTNTEQTVSQQLSDCCNIEIDMEDQLPKTVCDECLLQLEAAHEFYKKVHESQETLRTLFCNKKPIKLTEVQVTEEQISNVSDEEAQANHLEYNNCNEMEHNVRVFVEYIIENEQVEELLQSDENSTDINMIADIIEESETEEDALEQQESLSKNQAHITNWTNYSWICFICAEQSASYEQLLQHIKQIHRKQENEILFRCADCHKSFTRYFIFLNHVRLRHYASLALCCDICNVMCANFTELEQHRNVCNSHHHHVHIAICKKCGKAFQNDRGQHLHERLQHSNGALKHVCQQCGKQFNRSFALRMHERVHGEAKQFNCNICGHGFRQKGNLMTHMHAHSESKQYECVICKKSFKTNKNLDKHLLTHTNIKQFKCQYCYKLFRTNDAKISHERIHTGEMPFKCNYCDKRSRFRSTHLSHLKLHTGECPYECVPCDHKFRNWSNYNKHMKRKHSLEKQSVETK